MTAVQVSDAIWGSWYSGRYGPFQDNSGNLWVIARGTTYLTAFMSSDNGESWSTSYPSTLPIGQVMGLDAVYDGIDAIYVAIGAVIVNIRKFTISTHTWSEVYSSGTRPTGGTDWSNSHYPIALACRFDGSFVVAYQSTANAMGTPYRRVYYALLSAAGVWSAQGTEVESFVKGHNYDLKSAVLGAKARVHFFFTDSTSTDLLHRSLGDVNVLDTQGGLGSTNSYSAGYFSAYYDEIFNKVIVGPIGGKTYRATSGGANPQTWTVDTNNLGYSVSDDISSAAFAYDPISGKIYVFYRDSASNDPYWNSADSTVWTLANAAQLDEAGEVSGISARPIYDPPMIGPPIKGPISETLVGYDTARTRHAQGISFPQTTTVKALLLWLGQLNNPTGDSLVVELQSDSNGSPSGTVLETLGTYTYTQLPATAGPIAITGLSLSLEANTTYWIVFRRTGSVGTSAYKVGTLSTSWYSGGSLKTYNGSTWIVNSSTELVFALYTICTAIGVIYFDNTITYFDKLVLAAPVPPTTQQEKWFALL